eukprot:6464001-Amphidinium_carterae.1
MSSSEQQPLCDMEPGRAYSAPPSKPPARTVVLMLFAALAGAAVGRLSAPPGVSSAVPSAQAADSVSLVEKAPLPDDIKKGLKAYEDVFSSADPSMLGDLLHANFSMTSEDPPDYTVMGMESLKGFFGMLQAVRSGANSSSILPTEYQGFIKPYTLYDAYPPVRSYALGENIHVTEVNDKLKLDDGTVI